ncbi:MAG: hypothetical protein J0L99_09660 [Chitinophagales bacterium]|nr:hypothetical protein [Chitinophagales bacterium]
MVQLSKTELQQLARHPARLEPLLAALILQGRINPGNLFYRPKSLFKRAYSKDVAQFNIIQVAHGKKSQESQVWVDINREGFYDTLPEFLFHRPETASGYKNIDQRLRDSQKVQEEEAAARQFLLPFEQEFYRTRVNVEQEEQKLLSGFSNPMQRIIIERLWPDVPDIDNNSLSILFYLLPLAYTITGNRSRMEACFRTLLRENVTLTDIASENYSTEIRDNQQLGFFTLGVNMILEGILEEELPKLRIEIGPIPQHRMLEYIGNGNKKILLNILCNYFVPFELDVETTIKLDKPDEAFRFNDDPSSALLGYSTYI